MARALAITGAVFLAIFAVDVVSHREPIVVRNAPQFPLSLPGAGHNTLFYGVDRPAVPPSMPRNFGLDFDRGLPIAQIPVAHGVLTIGAPPKVYRTTFALPEMGLVWSNFLPTWLPTSLYGQWWYTEDWRAYVWNDNPARLEMTNGAEFIECVASPFTTNFTCPEMPDVTATIDTTSDPRILKVEFPNGTRNIYFSDTASTYGRYALYQIDRKETSGSSTTYSPVKSIVRTFVDDRSGTITASTFPDKRPMQINTWGPTDITARTHLVYADANAETRDCKPDPNTTPQCSSGLYCYDGKCSVKRGNPTLAQQCYSYYCDYWGWGVAWSIGTSLNITTAAGVVNDTNCSAALCGGAGPCWTNKTPCEGPSPTGDWKLQRIITPVPVAPPATRPLIYTLHYNVAAVNSRTFAGEDDPNLKFLDHIEDNRIATGALASSYVPAPAASGNVVQLSYDKVQLSRLMLKSVSYESGRDLEAVRLEFQDYGLFQRAWSDRSTPFLVGYSNGTPTQVTFKDPFGLTVQKTYSAIGGASSTTQAPCDPATGCNVQWGITSLTSAEGATSSFTYSQLNDASKGKLKTVTSMDGTVSTYEMDSAGRVLSLTKGNATRPECMKETYAYSTGSSFPYTARGVTKVVASQTTQTKYTICEGSTCPAFDQGAVIGTEVINPAPGRTVISSVAHASTGATGHWTSTKSVTEGATSAVLSILEDREPLVGVPARTTHPTSSITSTFAAAAGPTNNPATTTPVGSPTSPPAPCDHSKQPCGGATQSASTRTIAARPYPAEFDANALAALQLVKLTAYDASKVRSFDGSDTASGPQPKSGQLTGPGATSANSVEYDTGTSGAGAPISSTQTVNGITFRKAFDWTKVDTAIPNPSTRNHLTAQVAERTWANAGSGEVFQGGTWSGYSRAQFASQFPAAGYVIPDVVDLTTSTHLGDSARGHFKADGVTPAFPDWSLTRDPRYPRYPVVGCPAYINEAELCNSTDDCSCGSCLGVRCSTPPLSDTFTCKQTYIRDPKVVQDINNLSPNLYNDIWYGQQCDIPTCASRFSFRNCDPPP